MSKKALPRLPEDPTALSVAELDALESDAVKAAQDILADDPAEDADKADAQLAELEELNKVVEGVRAEKSSRDEAAGKASRREELAAAFTVSDSEGDEDDESDEDEDGDEPAASDDEDETDDADGAEPADESKEQPVTAAARGPRVAQVAKRSKAPEAPVVPAGPEFSVTAAADVPGTPAGQAFENWNGVAEAVLRRTRAYQNAGPRAYLRNGVFSIQRQSDPELTIDGPGDPKAQEVIRRATDEKRLKGGSLVAAAAWCAPVETIYQPFGIPISMDGMLDLPTITVNRGGFQFTTGPDWSTLSAGSPAPAQGWQGDYDDYGPGNTGEDGDGNPLKPCVTVDCPDFTPVYLEVDGLCVTANLLMQQSYPEILADFLRQLPAAHAHIMNKNRIAALVAASGTAIAQTAGPNSTDAGFTGVLASAELAVEDLRYKYRLPFNATVEAVFPHWAKLPMRADLSRRNGGSDALITVTDAQLDAYWASRGVRPQWVYDWQDASTGTSGGLGGSAAATTLPATFQAVVYVAGTFVSAGNNILTVDTLYDSTNLAKNAYTALWTEESWLVAKVGGASRLYTFTLNPCGLTGAQDVCASAG
jgi:hypothetical protein